MREGGREGEGGPYMTQLNHTMLYSTTYSHQRLPSSSQDTSWQTMQEEEKVQLKALRHGPPTQSDDVYFQHAAARKLGPMGYVRLLIVARFKA